MLQYRGHTCFESVRPDIILRSLHYLKLNNSLYDNIEEDVKIIPSFLVEEKRCDSLPLVALNNTNIDDKIPVIVENYSSGAEAKGVLLSIPNKNIQLMLKFLKAPFLVIKFFLLYFNDLPGDIVCNISIDADDTTLCSKYDQASDLWQQLEFASELESDLQDIVDWGRQWLINFNAGKTQLVSLTGLITLVLLV